MAPNKGKRALTKEDLKKGRESLQEMIKNNQKNLTRKETSGAFDELLDEDLYTKKFTESAHSNALLHTEKVFVLRAGRGSDSNRCTVYGTNALLGNPYFTNLRDYFTSCAATSHRSFEELTADFVKYNYIPLPVGNPFATAQVENKLVNLTMVPKM